MTQASTRHDRSGVWVIGGGGHAKVVIDALQSADRTVAGVLDSDPKLNGRSIMGVTITAPFDPYSLAELGIERAVIAIGNNKVRKVLAEQIPGVAWETVVHPHAYVAPSVRLFPGAVVVAGVVIQAESVIGSHAIINTGASVGHDCVVGDYAHVAPGARMAGAAQLGEGAWLGISSCVIEKRSIGAWTMIGAGAVVLEDIPCGVMAAGVPAKVFDRR